MLLPLLAVAACASKPPPVASPPEQPAAITGPECKVEGCCKGYGDVAYMQPDKIIMCTDGEPSQICDCH